MPHGTDFFVHCPDTLRKKLDYNRSLADTIGNGYYRPGNQTGQKMRILNFGSLNIDHVYAVDHFVRPGETLASLSYRRFCGGKGLNQSIALAHAGAQTFHAGMIGADGDFLRARLEQAGADTRFLRLCPTETGHAIIQVDRHSENCIILNGGANQAITAELISEVFAFFAPGDVLLLQNEISAMPEIIRAGRARGMRVVFNPAPMSPQVSGYPLELVDTFILNETEAQELSGEAEPQNALAALIARFPAATFVITLGKEGALCRSGAQMHTVPAPKVNAVDTTAAGDTFIGFFLAALTTGADVPAALARGCAAAAVCVTRPGAADSIPQAQEVCV